MNTYFAVIAAAMAFVASVNGEACSASQQSTAYMSMVGLLGPTLDSCASKSGYNMLYATALPTAEQTAAMCTVDECHQLIKNVQATNPPDCDLNIPTSGAVMNVKSLADNFDPQCSASTTEAPAPEATTAAPSEPEATTAAPTEPEATTAAPTEPEAPTAAPTGAPNATVTDAPTAPTAC